jgi:hypothetical protein
VKLFTGYDPREAQGWHAFVQSLIETSSDYELMPPLSGKTDGTNAFTLARFQIFDLVNWALPCCYLDGSDMLLRAPIEELFGLYDKRFAVQVVKHDYQTKHARKYVGTAMEADNATYPRKNWSSLMLINAGHRAHWKGRDQIEQALAEGNGSFLHRFGWLNDSEIGELPVEWNYLADEYPLSEDAKLLHWTAGMPGFKHYENAPMSNHWHDVAKTLHSER